MRSLLCLAAVVVVGVVAVKVLHVALSYALIAGAVAVVGYGVYKLLGK